MMRKVVKGNVWKEIKDCIIYSFNGMGDMLHIDIYTDIFKWGFSKCLI